MQTLGRQILALALFASVSYANPLLLVSEYATGNIRSYDPVTGASNALPAHYTPVGGNSSGADGMVRDALGRLYVNHGDGTIYRRSLDGASFSVFVDLNVDYLLDLTRTDTHLFAAQFGENVIHRIALADASTSTITGPPGTDRFDGVRVGPDGRLYAVESASGGIYAYNVTNATWSTFLSPDNAGDASQLAFGPDGRVFLSRTIGGQARIYAYTLTTSGVYTSGLNATSQTLIGSYGTFGAATGIRIGPDHRLYANAFNAGEVWRSNVGITAMEPGAFITGLNEPGSLFFEIDEPLPTTLLIDFGITNHPAASPDANGNHWNNLGTNLANAPTNTLTNLITTINNLSGISATTSGFGAGANTNGATSPDFALGSLAITNATRDSFFVATGNTARVVFSGLATNRTYRFECFGSRDAADTRVTLFTARGITTTSATLQTSGANIGAPPLTNANHAALAVLDTVRATASGVVTLSVSVASGSFGYLGALRLTELDEIVVTNEPPTATDAFWVGAPVAGRSVTAHFTYTDVEGDLESSSVIEWKVDVPPFTNTILALNQTNRSFIVPDQPGAFIRIAIQARAATGATNGTWAFSEWRGPIAPSNALAVFHLGNSFTRWGHIPLQLQNLATDAGYAHTFGEQFADGQGLGYQWTNGLAGGVLTRGTPSRLELATGGWDWLVLQPMSREWLPANLPALLDFTYRYASLALSNGTRVALYLYWNYLDEGTTEQDAINAVFETVRAALATNGFDTVIIPSGIAFSNAVAAIATLDREDLYQDNIHPSDVGYYLSALTHFATLYRQSPVGRTNGAISADANLDDPIVIDPTLAAALQQVAWDTARYHPPSGVTRARFDTWAESLTSTQRDWLDDPFTNGVPNLLRWAYGISPLAPDEPNLHLRAESDGESVEFRYQIGADAEDAGVTINPQWSTNLAAWINGWPGGLTAYRTNDEVHIQGEVAESNAYLRLLIQRP
jgi:hypothetical protein